MAEVTFTMKELITKFLPRKSLIICERELSCARATFAASIYICNALIYRVIL